MIHNKVRRQREVVSLRKAKVTRSVSTIWSLVPHHIALNLMRGMRIRTRKRDHPLVAFRVSGEDGEDGCGREIPPRNRCRTPQNRRAVDYFYFLDALEKLPTTNNGAITLLLADEQNVYGPAIARFIRWKQDCDKRLEQMKNSVQ